MYNARPKGHVKAALALFDSYPSSPFTQPRNKLQSSQLVIPSSPIQRFNDPNYTPFTALSTPAPMNEKYKINQNALPFSDDILAIPDDNVDETPLAFSDDDDLAIPDHNVNAPLVFSDDDLAIPTSEATPHKHKVFNRASPLSSGSNLLSSFASPLRQNHVNRDESALRYETTNKPEDSLFHDDHYNSFDLDSMIELDEQEQTKKETTHKRIIPVVSGPPPKKPRIQLQSRSVVDIVKKDYSIRPSGKYYQACTPQGKILYFPIIKASTTLPPQRTKLLHTDIHTMMNKIAQDEIYSGHVEAESLRNLPPPQQRKETQLWVDKYTPKTYTGLIGDESLNRQVLSWVKQWDYCVFKINKNAKDIFVNPTYKKKDQPATMYNGSPFVKNKDPLRRPEKKIMLLSGRAGRGKTTLAHIIAKKAGYNVVEINARYVLGIRIL